MRTETTRLGKSRGQAAVELSLLAIIIIPCFLYIIFLDDLLRFKQDQQEAMVAATWDFSTVNYDHQVKQTNQYIPNMPVQPKQSKTGFGPVITHWNRYAFADHLSSTPRFEDPAGSKDEHHLAVGAHQCWLTQGANQVTCTPENVNAAANFSIDATLGARPALRNFVANGHGGLYVCKGNVGVMNHWLPSGVLFFSKEELSSRKYYGETVGGGIGNNASNVHGAGTGASSVYLFPEDSFGMITHPWAMAEEDAVDPSDHSGPLYDRVTKVYRALGPIGAITSAAIYPAKAILQQLISPVVIFDSPVGDLIYTPEISFSPSLSSPKVNGFYSSQYHDYDSNNDVERTYNSTKRGTWYMGAKTRP